MNAPSVKCCRGGVTAALVAVTLGLFGLSVAVWAAPSSTKAGKGAAKPEEPEVVKPAYTFGPSDRNPMISSTAVVGNPAPPTQEPVFSLAGVIRQGPHLAAMVNGKLGKAGDTLSLTVNGQPVQVEVLEVEANPPAVHLRYQGTDVWKRLPVIPPKK